MEKDKNGYPIGRVEHSNLIHRQIAYSEIYLKNRKKYPKKFSEYVVHHINTNKEDFSVKNLYLCSKEEHNAIHEEQKKNLKRFKTKKELDEFLNNWNDKKQKKLDYEKSYSKKFYVPKEVYQQPKIIETKKPKKREKKKIKGIIKIIFLLVALILAVWLLSNLFDNEEVSGSNIDLLKCGMSNEQLFNLFGEPSQELAWETIGEMPNIQKGEPISFVFHYENKIITTQGQYYKSIGRVAMHYATIRDKETNEIIKKIDGCIPANF